MSDARVDFTRSAAERIARTVRLVEQGERDQTGPRYRKVVESGVGGGTTIRLGKTTALFSKNTLGAIELYERCDPPTEQRNLEDYALPNVVNHWADIEADRWVMVAKAKNGYWYIITAECG